ncbi:uncharacterized protein LOC119734000 [Patiria miniata]|uniref:C2H2-type domain-containing protein n=1 Tax=Patiria miniata TaxID=46514 RepID=A0A914AIT8_PATMI|nr:uncharacterized protein LOC119734000 [Patiria miniata]
MELTCFKCNRRIRVNEGTKELAVHLRWVHGIWGSTEERLICCQNGCMKTFTLMNSFLRHIRLFHMFAPIIKNPNGQEIQNHELENDEHNAGSDSEPEEEDQDADDPEQADIEYFNNFDEDLVKQVAALLIVKLRSSASVTFSTRDKVINGTKVIFSNTLQALRQHTLSVMQNHGIDPNADDVQELFGKFSSLENPFSGLETPHQQMNYMLDRLLLVPPVETALGTRIDQAVDRKTGQTIQKLVTETFQYIPVLEVLKLVLNEQVRQLVDSEKKSPQGYFIGYQDGYSAGQHGFLIDHPKALRFQLYYDDVEVVNPLGSKTGIHKLGLFYYSIQNLPHHYNSSMNSIFLLVVCYSADLKKYGFAPIFETVH